MKVNAKQSVEVTIDVSEQRKIIFAYFKEQFDVSENYWIDQKTQKMYYTQSCYHNDTEDIFVRDADKNDQLIVDMINFINYGKK